MLVDDFNSEIIEWEKHCENHSYSSSVFDYINCKPLEHIRQMGYAALPMMREYYKQPGADYAILSAGFPIIIKELFPDFNVPKNLQGRIEDVAKFVYEFLGDKVRKSAQQ